MIYSFTKRFSTKHLKRVNSPNILPAKLSRYTVFINAMINTCYVWHYTEESWKREHHKYKKE